jgi:hypothetical protein
VTRTDLAIDAHFNITAFYYQPNISMDVVQPVQTRRSMTRWVAPAEAETGDGPFCSTIGHALNQQREVESGSKRGRDGYQTQDELRVRYNSISVSSADGG